MRMTCLLNYNIQYTLEQSSSIADITLRYSDTRSHPHMLLFCKSKKGRSFVKSEILEYEGEIPTYCTSIHSTDAHCCVYTSSINLASNCELLITGLH